MCKVKCNYIAYFINADVLFWKPSPEVVNFIYCRALYPPRCGASRLTTTSGDWIREHGYGGADPGRGRDPDICPVYVLVRGELWGQRRQQNHPQRISLPGHSLSVPHHLHRRLPPAVAAGMGSTESGAARQVLPVVHPAISLREILRLCVGSLQHMESASFLRSYRWVLQLCVNLGYDGATWSSSAVTRWCVWPSAGVSFAAKAEQLATRTFKKLVDQSVLQAVNIRAFTRLMI